jgi:hypothetical protein
MKSILIRYTSSKYADSYLSGKLYMSSLSRFWDIKIGRVNYNDLIAGKVSNLEYMKAMQAQLMKQQDFQEGVSAQIPIHHLKPGLRNAYGDHIVNDVRCRVEAYGYCNLLCFFRVDCIDTKKKKYADEENLSYIARAQGIDLSAESINKMTPDQLYSLLKRIIPANGTLAQNKNHIIQLPDRNMDSYGDMVIIIKDEEAFIDRVLNAVKKQGGECVAGDIRYHKMRDRKNPDSDPTKRHSVSILSYGLSKDGSEGLFDMKNVVCDGANIIWYGCLDKYEPFRSQKEWRVCWLPKERNFDAAELDVGPLDDIIELVPTNRIRQRLLELNPGYIPGFVNTDRKNTRGTVLYDEFKKIVEGIDGKCRVIMEIV